MTKEERYFRDNFPDYVCGNELLSPYWDFFESGAEMVEKELEQWKAEWQEQTQKAIDEGYARTLQTIEIEKLKKELTEKDKQLAEYKVFAEVWEKIQNNLLISIITKIKQLRTFQTMLMNLFKKLLKRTSRLKI